MGSEDDILEFISYLHIQGDKFSKKRTNLAEKGTNLAENLLKS